MRIFSKRRVLICLLLTLTGVVYAQQAGGDFCVRAYEDRNANTMRDTGEGEAFEPLLRAGIGADLLDETGVIVASALLADSPTADQGVICFQFLPEGQYTIQITSAEYRPTTPDTMTAIIRAGELPAVMELGVQSLVTQMVTPVDTPVDDTTPQLERLLFAAAGAVVAALVMQVLGLIIYLIRFGRKPKPTPKTDTGVTATFKRPN